MMGFGIEGVGVHDAARGLKIRSVINKGPYIMGLDKTKPVFRISNKTRLKQTSFLSYRD